MNKLTAMAPSMSNSVVAALRDLGLRKAGTPLLIASTPVSAAQPEEKARSYEERHEGEAGEGARSSAVSDEARGLRLSRAVSGCRVITHGRSR